MTTKLFLVLTSMVVLLGCSNADDKITNRVNHIASDVITIDSISDFSSNENKPVKDVQNIGPSLYKKMRAFQKHRIISTQFKEKESDKYDTDRYGDGRSFIVFYKNSNNEILSFYLLYSYDEDFFRITGY